MRVETQLVVTGVMAIETSTSNPIHYAFCGAESVRAGDVGQSLCFSERDPTVKTEVAITRPSKSDKPDGECAFVLLA